MHSLIAIFPTHLIFFARVAFRYRGRAPPEAQQHEEDDGRASEGRREARRVQKEQHFRCGSHRRKLLECCVWCCVSCHYNRQCLCFLQSISSNIKTISFEAHGTLRLFTCLNDALTACGWDEIFVSYPIYVT